MSLSPGSYDILLYPRTYWNTVSRTETILVAEDDTDDAFFLQRAFKMAGISTWLQFVRDGQEAIDYLSGEGVFADRTVHPTPDLLLLDLKMPRMNGFQVLEWVRQQPGLKRLPVIIFSSSDEGKDINRAYDLGANSYLIKPHSSEELINVAQRVKQYWVDTSQVPDPFVE
jgi:CheY-like chemotaxis protein